MDDLSYLACGISKCPLEENYLEFNWYSESELYVLAFHAESLPN